MTRLTLRRPDDWHLHLRDGAMLEAVLPDTARDFGRAIIMPNLVPPVVTARDARAYHARIMDALPAGMAFEPLMTLYLTDDTDPADVVAAHRDGLITAVKLYPAGATTNSASGVTDIEKPMATLEAMAEAGVPLLIHGEVTDPAIDIFDREAAFIERHLAPLRARLPELRITLEHVTTADGIAYVEATENLAATITVHHLIIDRNHILAGGIRPHYYCLPVAKRATHRDALVMAATSGNPRIFLGTDSAPHLDDAKESACGCAGCYTAPVALSCLAHVFEAGGALEKLEAFTSLNGPAWYGLPPSDKTVTLEKGAPQAARPNLQTADGPVTVFDPGFPLEWQVSG